MKGAALKRSIQSADIFVIMNTTTISVLCLVALMAAFVPADGVGLPGGRTEISQEELQGERYVGYVNDGLNKFHEMKASSNGAECVVYTGQALSGTQQVVAGMSYDLSVKFTPSKKTTDECNSADISSVAEETCKVNIWVKPGNQGQVVKVENCA